MDCFDDELHTIVQSEDGTCTAYSKEYDEHYHSTKDGALQESLYKHVVPTLTRKAHQKEVAILDICFGLGFNTLATLYYTHQHNLDTKLRIYSPELDAKLVASLKHFTYPQEFEPFVNILHHLVTKKRYEDERLSIELFIGDAREYVTRFENCFDVVYQDAFSPAVNPTLWTQEYFAQIARAIKKDGILSTYSTAFKTRLALYNNGFEIYLNEGDGYRNATLASKTPLLGLKKVDMEHKIACNAGVEPLRD